MPELAEVDFFRKRWALAATGARIVRVHTHDTKKILRGVDLLALRGALTGATLDVSAARAKQMAFRFSGNAWLGIHLGMSGELVVAPADHVPGKHDHLVLFTEKHALVFKDPRMFGAVEFYLGAEPPPWWTKIAPSLLSPVFTVDALAAFLRRRARAPIKAVLLMQERFPGVGNWMADEILWRAAIHPARLAGSLRPAEIQALWRECRRVCRQALATIAGRGDYLPPDLNAHIPRSWLFLHRWTAGGRCPKTRKPLARATIGGRTTCWSPARQKLKQSAARQPTRPRIRPRAKVPRMAKP
ncbi:MAG: DNA-formamidopyrimidine glycosylase family protein [Opitutaceae bacterium]